MANYPSHTLRVLLLLAVSLYGFAAPAHNTETPHREFTAEELQELGLEELISTAAVTTTGESLAGSQVYSIHGPVNTDELWRTWGFDPGVIISLALAGGLYWIGVRRLWRATHIGAGIRRRDAAWYALGWFWLFVALVSPLHPWGEVLFSAHMVQHELLMLVAAPLLILGRPVIAFLWAMPLRIRRKVGRAGANGWVKRAWDILINPFVAWLIHAVILWSWHIPSWFQATLTSDWIHSLQHSSFLVSALLFWFAVLHGRSRELGYGMAVVYMFTTAVHSGALGALLTFTTFVWYPAYTETARVWGLSALEDQQIGGIIMWIPACIVYIVAGLALFIAWMGESERRAVLTESTWCLNTDKDPAAAIRTGTGGGQ